MSNISSSDVWKITLMRWIARILSIPWAFLAFFLTWWGIAQYISEEKISLHLAVYSIILIIVALMYVGAAIIASVWRKEALGGGILMADGMFILAFMIIDGTLPRDFSRWSIVDALLFFTMALPPLVAGFLFLVCHWKSKRQKVKHT